MAEIHRSDLGAGRLRRLRDELGITNREIGEQMEPPRCESLVRGVLSGGPKWRKTLGREMLAIMRKIHERRTAALVAEVAAWDADRAEVEAALTGAGNTVRKPATVSPRARGARRAAMLP